MNILIVEDELLLALDLEAMLEDCGCKILAVCTTSLEAKNFVATTTPALALVDIQLLDGPTGIETARHLTGHYKIPVVFTTANTAMLSDDFAGAIGAISKPYSSNCIERTIQFLSEALGDPPPKLPVPSCLKLSDRYRRLWSV